MQGKASQDVPKVDADSAVRIEKLLDARRRGDLHALASFLHPLMTYELTPASGGEASATHAGREAFLSVTQSDFELFERLEDRISALDVQEDRAVVELRSMARSRVTDKVFPLRSCALLTFRDGLVEEWVEYTDTDVLAQLKIN